MSRTDQLWNQFIKETPFLTNICVHSTFNVQLNLLMYCQQVTLIIIHPRGSEYTIFLDEEKLLIIPIPILFASISL